MPALRWAFITSLLPADNLSSNHSATARLYVGISFYPSIYIQSATNRSFRIDTGRIVFPDGSFVDEFDFVSFATGYEYSLPF